MDQATLEKLLPEQPLDAFLKSHIERLKGPPEISLIEGGASNLTFRVSYVSGDLIVRRPPPGKKAAGAHDMGRESLILTALQNTQVPVPKVYAYCDDEDIIGSPFFVMDFVEGTVPRRSEPHFSEAESYQVCRAFVDTWQALHGVDWRGTELGRLDRGDGYAARQIAGWTKRYRDAKTPDAPDFEQVIEWLADAVPPDQGHCLIHNDFRLDNLILEPDQPGNVRAVLDWELATIGCPLMDLGASLAYWIQADDDAAFHGLRRQPTHLSGMWSRERLWEYYATVSGLDLQHRSFYEVYGLFRLAGIAQQIYYRFYQGQFETKEAAQFIHGVRVLESRCLKTMDQSKVS